MSTFEDMHLAKPWQCHFEGVFFVGQLPVGMPRSLLPRPKPLMTVPDILIGYGDSGAGPPTILTLFLPDMLVATAAALVVIAAFFID